jgi:hypothetical protein
MVEDDDGDPSYHDVVVIVGKQRYRLFDCGYGLELRCTRAGGWELWDRSGGSKVEPRNLGGEYSGQPFSIEIRGIVVCGPKIKRTKKAQAGGWAGVVDSETGPVVPPQTR